ncbi:MAG: ATP-binding cassette domain-containing protein [Gammaproteobacteria bacterium]
MIDVQNLSKRFGAVRALDGVSFAAGDGRITGLLGPNGAGKSTCLRILSTVIKPSGGSARVGDTDLAAMPLVARRLLGVLPHGSGLYPQLTARENVAYYGRLHGLPEPLLKQRTDALIARLDLGTIADRKAKGFSQGEKTKVALARALVHDPQHLLLDEPTSGLDVMATRHLREWLRELRAQGRCVLLSSHVMQEVEALVDDLVIVAGGRVTLAGTPSELAERFPGRSLEEIFVAAVSGAGRAAP